MEIKVLHQVMEWNEDVSEQVKEILAAHQICMINLMGSPGAGKTSLISALIGRLKKDFRIGVIEGDIAGQVDAERIAGLGIPTVQLNTDGACHIEAMSIRHILPEFPLDDLDVIFVENIGNLVCPAEFLIGESLRITLLSIPEGDDKVEKYPLMFTDTDCLVLNKYDMLPYFDFDEAKVRANYETVNPDAPLFRVSSRTGDEMDALSDYLAGQIRRAKEGNPAKEESAGDDTDATGKEMR
ncbi:MAG TPA: hydrogenase nickel incorporation protein HypB [Candidatus Anaerobutyricum avicola]|nr:hydrogenase nickel incorporation protein HypB [Candidatus Anaerobutyricum avicola]